MFSKHFGLIREAGLRVLKIFSKNTFSVHLDLSSFSLSCFSFIFSLISSSCLFSSLPSSFFLSSLSSSLVLLSPLLSVFSSLLSFLFSSLVPPSFIFSYLLVLSRLLFLSLCLRVMLNVVLCGVCRPGRVVVGGRGVCVCVLPVCPRVYRHHATRRRLWIHTRGRESSPVLLTRICPRLVITCFSGSRKKLFDLSHFHVWEKIENSMSPIPAIIRSAKALQFQQSRRELWPRWFD